MSAAMECPACGEIDLVEVGEVTVERYGLIPEGISQVTITEYECEECGHYETSS